MKENRLNKEVDAYLDRATIWQEEMKKLRTIILDCGLTEELKWGKPCYTYHKKNIVIIQGFKKYCAILFFKGYLMNDPEDILIKTGVNTQIGRQIRFANVEEIAEMESTLKAYINEAIAVEKSGVKAEK